MPWLVRGRVPEREEQRRWLVRAGQRQAQARVLKDHQQVQHMLGEEPQGEPAPLIRQFANNQSLIRSGNKSFGILTQCIIYRKIIMLYVVPFDWGLCVDTPWQGSVWVHHNLYPEYDWNKSIFGVKVFFLWPNQEISRENVIFGKFLKVSTNTISLVKWNDMT